MYKLCWLFLLATLVSCGKKADEIQKQPRNIGGVGSATNQGKGDYQSLKRLQEAIDSQDTQFLDQEIRKNPQIINKEFENGETPLTYAIRLKNENIINKLIEVSDVNKGGKGGLAPIHISIISNLPNVMNTLINNGANIEAKSMLNETPLYLAISFERNNMSLTLLSLGANYNIKSDLEISARELAQGFRQTRVLNLINKIESIKSEEYDIESLIEAIESDNIYLFNFIIKKYSNLKTLSEGKNVLSRIIQGDSLYKIKYIEKLLEFGLNANGEKNDSSNPLIEAAKIDDIYLVQTLHQNGAEINTIESEPTYTNALFEAVRNINFSMVDYLYRNGAETKINYVFGSNLYFIDACTSLPRKPNGNSRRNIDLRIQHRLIKNKLDC